MSGFNPNSPSSYGQTPGAFNINTGQIAGGGGTGVFNGGTMQPNQGVGGSFSQSPYMMQQPQQSMQMGGMPQGMQMPNMNQNYGGMNQNLGQFSGTNQSNPTAGSGGQFGGANGGAFGTGSVGQANYGNIAAIQNLLSQNPNAAGYLRSMGMMPSINGVPLDQVMQGASTMSINGHPTGGATQGGQPTRDAQGNYHMPDGSVIGSDGRTQLAGPGGASVSSASSSPSLSQQLTSYRRTPSPFEQQTQGQISNMYANPSGFNQQQQQQLYNQATNPIAMAQQQAMRDTQANAVQRGAATNNSDIQDQLNRVAMSGANQASQANTNVGLGLASASRQGTLGALGAANPLINSQLRDTSDLRNTLLGANVAQQQLGNTQFNMALGGSRQ